MGSSEGGTPGKMDQSTPGAAPGSAGYPEWAAAFQQAYYNQGAQPPPGYFNPASSAPQHHYMWGGQHMMPPYGTPPPPPYGAMYPPGGMYGHPSMSTGQQQYMNYAIPSPGSELVTTTGTVGQEDVKSPVDPLKDKSKRAKVSTAKLPAVTVAHANKLTSPTGNGGFSQSGDDDEDDDEDDNEGEEDGSQQNMHMFPMEGGQKAGASGMVATVDYWQQQRGPQTSVGKKRAPPSGPAGQSLGVPPEMWLQDEREVKRQRRKQSNRESARRSRLRKQAECEELGTRVDALLQENAALRGELKRFHEERRRLQTENDCLQEQLNVCGTDGSGLRPAQVTAEAPEVFAEIPEELPTDSNQMQRFRGGLTDATILNNEVGKTDLTPDDSFVSVPKEDNSGSGLGGPDTVAAG